MSYGNWPFPDTFRAVKYVGVILRGVVLPGLTLLSALFGGGCDRSSGRLESQGTNIVILSEANFQSEVIASKTPVLVDFWAPWCAPCRSLSPIVDAIADDFAGRAKVAKVNVDDAPALAERYGIQGIPTLLYFRDGRVLDQVMGGAAKGELAGKLDTLILESKSSAVTSAFVSTNR